MNKIHHIGIATNDLTRLKEEYLKQNYIYVDEVYDKFQKATLCLLKRGAECIELIYTNNKESSVYDLCKNNYKKEYHVCYIVKSLKEEISKLKREGCILIQDICYAELLKSNICFLYTKDRKVIELVEDNG